MKLAITSMKITIAIFATLTMIVFFTYILSKITMLLIPEQVGNEIIDKSLTSLGIFYIPQRGASDADQGSMNHEKISTRITTCRKITNEKQVLESDRRIIYINSGTDDEKISYAIIELDTLERRAAYASNDILKKRHETQTETEKNYKSMQWSTFISIIIGLLTTVFISISSSKLFDEDTKIALTLKILAILFPAIGTASAAIFAFYSPNEKYIRSRQTSASLGQIHREIAAEIYKIDCIHLLDNNVKNQLSAKLDGWELQYGNLLSNAAIRDLTQQSSSASSSNSTGQPK